MIPDEIKPNLEHILHTIEHNLQDEFWESVSMIDKAHLAGSFMGGSKEDYDRMKKTVFEGVRKNLIAFKDGYTVDTEGYAENYMNTTVIKVAIKKKKDIKENLVDIDDLKGRYFELCFIPEVRTDYGERRIEFMPFIFHKSVNRTD